MIKSESHQLWISPHVTERSNATEWAYMQEGENARGGAVTHLDFFFSQVDRKLKMLRHKKKKSSVQKTETDKDVVGMRKAFQSGETVGQF